MEEITPEPFIAQSLRIRVLKNRKESICLRAEVYGCEIPRGKNLSILNEQIALTGCFCCSKRPMPYKRFNNFNENKFGGSLKKRRGQFVFRNSL